MMYICITINDNTMTTLITPSIEKRATELMLTGIEPLQAVKQALIDEMNFIGELINSSNGLTERGKIASDYLFQRYDRK